MSLPLLLAYAILGAGIKFIDQAFDIGAWDKKLGILVAIPIAILFGFLMIKDVPYSTSLLLAILVSVAIARKVDNPAFILGSLIVLGLPALFIANPGRNFPLHEILRIFGILTLTGILDEFISDSADKGLLRNHKFLRELLIQRPFMKICLILLALFEIVPFFYFFCLYFFDMAYMFIEWYSYKIILQKER